jgi:hypothetical protein
VHPTAPAATKITTITSKTKVLGAPIFITGLLHKLHAVRQNAAASLDAFYSHAMSNYTSELITSQLQLNIGCVSVGGTLFSRQGKLAACRTE